ncbi:GapA-binding peptide SR1P [Jeotgalibacillus soli]|uniref:Phosphoesterase n=1 Tax=Jeotgalibacillus soli TaxID=889306 RepID=A0A0C2R4R7_9BACL|nr:GapA-binding peptide SR1P [Jeotgalibacillus soli]KIL45270.1 hypothetical protein KP78_28140 [Jeotgalibacillus soli]
MGIIVCQTCNGVVTYFEDEKVTTLYSNHCPNCSKDQKIKKKHR